MSSNSWPGRGAYFEAVGKWPRSARAPRVGVLVPLSRGLRGALRPPTWRPPHGPPAAWPTPRHPPRGFPAPGARRGPVHLDWRSAQGRAVCSRAEGAQNGVFGRSRWVLRAHGGAQWRFQHLLWYPGRMRSTVAKIEIFLKNAFFCSDKTLEVKNAFFRKI
jgi:hypothetical protein